MVDHVSDGFVDVASPLVLLCEAAQEGDRQLVEERAEMFVEHAKQLEKVGGKLCPSFFSPSSPPLLFPSTSLPLHFTPPLHVLYYFLLLQSPLLLFSLPIFSVMLLPSQLLPSPLPRLPC